MHRKRWNTVEVPDGWLHVIRGLRPSSTKWPRTKPVLQEPNSNVVHSVSTVERGGLQPSSVRSLLRIQAAIASLGQRRGKGQRVPDD